MVAVIVGFDCVSGRACACVCVCVCAFAYHVYVFVCVPLPYHVYVVFVSSRKIACEGKIVLSQQNYMLKVKLEV